MVQIRCSLSPSLPPSPTLSLSLSIVSCQPDVPLRLCLNLLSGHNLIFYIHTCVCVCVCSSVCFSYSHPHTHTMISHDFGARVHTHTHTHTHTYSLTHTSAHTHAHQIASATPQNLRPLQHPEPRDPPAPPLPLSPHPPPRLTIPTRRHC